MNGNIVSHVQFRFMTAGQWIDILYCTQIVKCQCSSHGSKKLSVSPLLLIDVDFQMPWVHNILPDAKVTDRHTALQQNKNCAFIRSLEKQQMFWDEHERLLTSEGAQEQLIGGRLHPPVQTLFRADHHRGNCAEWQAPCLLHLRAVWGFVRNERNHFWAAVKHMDQKKNLSESHEYE